MKYILSTLLAAAIVLAPVGVFAQTAQSPTTSSLQNQDSNLQGNTQGIQNGSIGGAQQGSSAIEQLSQSSQVVPLSPIPSSIPVAKKAGEKTSVSDNTNTLKYLLYALLALGGFLIAVVVWGILDNRPAASPALAPVDLPKKPKTKKKPKKKRKKAHR